jgi:hypothetical protein
MIVQGQVALNCTAKITIRTTAQHGEMPDDKNERVALEEESLPDECVAPAPPLCVGEGVSEPLPLPESLEEEPEEESSEESLLEAPLPSPFSFPFPWPDPDPDPDPDPCADEPAILFPVPSALLTDPELPFSIVLLFELSDPEFTPLPMPPLIEPE